MENKRKQIEHARLTTVISYNKNTGVFKWKKDRGLTVKKGEIAGRVNMYGYREITIDSVMYKEHRLAWFYVNTSWPVGVIDHINGIKDDNRFSNLRDVSKQINCHNRISCNSNTGVTGVHWIERDREYVATIHLNGKAVLNKRFKSVHDAELAYKTKKSEVINSLMEDQKNVPDKLRA
jgi:hypothetical protein